MLGWEEVMTQLIAWTRSPCKPHCHLRLGDGEFWSMLGGHPGHARNGDNLGYFPETLGKQLLAMLHEIQRQAPNYGNLLVGGVWESPPQSRELMDREQLWDGIPWCCAQGPITGVLWGTDTIDWLSLLALLPQRKVLVCNDRTKDARYCFGAEHISIPATDCWLDTARVLAEASAILEQDPKAYFLWAASMAAEPWAWTLWQEFPESCHVDVGHLFDAAFGIHNRIWSRNAGKPGDGRIEHYEQFFTPFVQRAIPEKA